MLTAPAFADIVRVLELHQRRATGRKLAADGLSRPNPMQAPQLSKPLAPGMLRWSSLGMRLQEMVQDVQQGHHMLLVASDELGLPNIVNNHVQNFFTAVFLGQEVRSKCCCSDFG